MQKAMQKRLCLYCGGEIQRSETAIFCKESCQKKRRNETLSAQGTTKVCNVCEKEKSVSEFYGSGGKCKRCAADDRREYMRKRLAEDAEFKERQRINSGLWSTKNPERYKWHRDNHNFDRRQKDSHVKLWFEWKKENEVQQDNHVKLFEKFKKTEASKGWWARYAKAIGKPWRNPRMSPRCIYAIRYKKDLAFRLRQINKATWRRELLLARNDGTINFYELLAERDSCPYCGTQINESNAVVDHMNPLKLGGDNGKHNLTICCRDCNKKKAAKSFADWVDTLSPGNKRAALAWYKKKQGKQANTNSDQFRFVFEWNV